MTRAKDFIELARTHKHHAALGGLVGLLIGDAVGVCYEFHEPEHLPARKKIDMTPPVGFRRAHAGVPTGTWSDDGAQALCLLASLTERGRFSLMDFASKLQSWLNDGYMAVDGQVFDVGIQTEDALQNLNDGAQPHESGGKSEMDNGNGSLMRVLPLALWHTESDENLVRDAHQQSKPTHGHPRSLVACAFYCLVARGYLKRLTDPWAWADQRLQAIYEALPDHGNGRQFLAELDMLRRFPQTDRPRGTGYVLDTIWSAKMALEAPSFEEVIRNAILLGHDTDTTAAVAGGLAGIRFGLADIPERWLGALRGFELVAPLIEPILVIPGDEERRLT